MASDASLICLIVDDEPLALDVIERYVKQTSFLYLLCRCASATEALRILENEQVDLVFLDIQMPDITGVQLSRMISKDIKIIFTTAYPDFALEGFKVNAVDYLLKPISYEEFYKAALKAQDLQRLQQGLVPEKGEEYFFVRSEYRQIKIEIKDIVLIEGLKDYVKIHLKSSPKAVLTMLSLKSLEERLPSAQFMRIHRSFIVALDQIEAIERSQVIIRDTRITVADQYKERFNEFVQGRSIR